MKYIYTTLFFLLGLTVTRSQDDLMSLLDYDSENTTNYAEATFKAGRLVNGHTTEVRAPKELEFLISHRFGRLNAGGDELFGLDDAFIRLGLEYGFTPFLTIGIGRSSVDKTFDGYAKAKLLRQSSGARQFPISLVYFSSVAYKSIKNQEGFDTFASKMAYTQQVLISRKFSSSFSMQLMPTVVHRNRVEDINGDNNLMALGVGGRIKVSKRVALNAEYYHRLNEPENESLYNSIAIGFDIETGGHVFQLHLTNSRQMIERGFVGETNGDFFGGDIHFGFNVSRVF